MWVSVKKTKSKEPGDLASAARLKAAGRSEEQAVAAKPMADYDAKLHLNAQQSSNFVRVVYRSLK